MGAYILAGVLVMLSLHAHLRKRLFHRINVFVNRIQYKEANLGFLLALFSLILLVIFVLMKINSKSLADVDRNQLKSIGGDELLIFDYVVEPVIRVISWTGHYQGGSFDIPALCFWGALTLFLSMLAWDSECYSKSHRLLNEAGSITASDKARAIELLERSVRKWPHVVNVSSLMVELVQSGSFRRAYEIGEKFASFRYYDKGDYQQFENNFRIARQIAASAMKKSPVDRAGQGSDETSYYDSVYYKIRYLALMTGFVVVAATLGVGVAYLIAWRDGVTDKLSYLVTGAIVGGIVGIIPLALIQYWEWEERVRQRK